VVHAGSARGLDASGRRCSAPCTAFIKTWVDVGFKNQFVEHAASLGVDAEVVPRNSEFRGFHVVKRRRVAERTIGWIMLHRGLARDYETLPTRVRRTSAGDGRAWLCS